MKIGVRAVIFLYLFSQLCHHSSTHGAEFFSHVSDSLEHQRGVSLVCLRYDKKPYLSNDTDQVDSDCAIRARISNH